MTTLNRPTPLFVLAVVTIIVTAFSTWVIATVVTSQQVAPRQATWARPDIPQCDKELWLRIKDGCEERDRDE